MSRTVVTPNVSDWARAPGTRCTCASIKPGSTVPPAASITSSPSWAAGAAEHSVIRPSANRTEVQSRDFVPSNALVFTLVLGAATAPSPREPERPEQETLTQPLLISPDVSYSERQCVFQKSLRQAKC